MKNAVLTHETQIEIPFHDVDMMRIAWHGHYVKYFEVARCELLDKMDYGYIKMMESGYAWPVVDLTIRYVKPARFGQVVTVLSGVMEYENRLKINYVISDAETGMKLTKGFTVQVAVNSKTEELLLASPPILLEKLGIKS